jgi:hypothetical protein
MAIEAMKIIRHSDVTGTGHQRVTLRGRTWPARPPIPRSATSDRVATSSARVTCLGEPEPLLRPSCCADQFTGRRYSAWITRKRPRPLASAPLRIGRYLVTL